MQEKPLTFIVRGFVSKTKVYNTLCTRVKMNIDTIFSHKYIQY